MDNIIVNDISEYINQVLSIRKRLEEDKSYLKRKCLFRGQSDKSFELIPSLGRYDAGHSDIGITERNLIFTAKRKLPGVFTNDLDPLELLSMLQHYGIPTRLLDVTENALVALFFACDGNEMKDGEVIVFDNPTFDVSMFPLDYAIAETYKFAIASFTPLNSFYNSIILQPYFLEQKAYLESLDQDGGTWVKQCCKNPLFVYGTNRLTRQMIQQGRYILFPNKIDESGSGFFSRIEALPKDHECIAGRIEIPAEKKKGFIKEMQLLGIDKGMLFSDNADIVCQEIKERIFNNK